MYTHSCSPILAPEQMLLGRQPSSSGDVTRKLTRQERWLGNGRLVNSRVSSILNLPLGLPIAFFSIQVIHGWIVELPQKLFLAQSPVAIVVACQEVCSATAHLAFLL